MDAQKARQMSSVPETTSISKILLNQSVMRLMNLIDYEHTQPQNSAKLTSWSRRNDEEQEKRKLRESHDPEKTKTPYIWNIILHITW